MASKLLLLPLLLALSCLHSSTLASAQSKDAAAALATDGRSAAVLVLIDATRKSSPPIIVDGLGPLRAGQTRKVRIVSKDVVSNLYARFGVNGFMEFNAYDPARDRGRSVVYWKADDEGWRISYDNKHYGDLVPWEHE